MSVSFQAQPSQHQADDEQKHAAIADQSGT
jgi:hypothetical protein